MDRGHHVTLVSFSRPPDWVREHYPASREWLVVPKRRARFDPALLIGLRRLIKDRHIQVIHAHCETSSFYSGLAGRLSRVPTAGTFHRSALRYYRANWKSPLLFGSLNSYIAVSAERRERMHRELGLSPRRTTLIHWGIDPNLVPVVQDRRRMRRQLGVAGDGHMLLSLGHLGPIKGHQDTILALQLIRRELPDVRVYIAGDGTDKERETLSSQVAELNLGEHVVLLGQITNPLDWMQACDVFVQPSREEAFGLVFLEAGLCAVPSVATRVGGIPDTIVDGVTGYLVDAGDVEAIAARVLQLLKSPAEALAMGQAAKQRILEHFNLSRQIDCLEAHLLKLSGSKKP